MLASDASREPGPPQPRPEGRGRLGLVVCGGLSRRMGADKALLDLAGARLIDRAVEALGDHVERVVLATGEAPRYGELGLETVVDSLPGAGPLAGLAAGLERTRELDLDALVVLACDTPRVDAELLGLLVARHGETLGDACLLRTEEGLEPLCAVYRVTCLEPVRAALAGGRRRMTSFHEEVEVTFLEEADLPEALRARRPATNVNTPDEYAAERAWFGRQEGLERTA